MNQAVTIGVNKAKDGKLTYAVLADPNTPHREQRRHFRHQLRAQHGKFDEVQLWTSSGGRVKRAKTTNRVMPVVLTVAKAVAPKAVAPVAPVVVEPVVGEDLLSMGAAVAPVTAPAATGAAVVPAQEPAKTGTPPAPSTVPNRAANLVKARAAAAAKRATAKTAKA